MSQQQSEQNPGPSGKQQKIQLYVREAHLSQYHIDDPPVFRPVGPQWAACHSRRAPQRVKLCLITVGCSGCAALRRRSGAAGARTAAGWSKRRMWRGRPDSRSGSGAFTQPAPPALSWSASLPHLSLQRLQRHSHPQLAIHIVKHHRKSSMTTHFTPLCAQCSALLILF